MRETAGLCMFLEGVPLPLSCSTLLDDGAECKAGSSADLGLSKMESRFVCFQ